MENKYYTPETEEFYVGFEYEMFTDFGNDKSYWGKEVFTRHSKMNDFGYGEECPTKKYIRVKYLDSEDFKDFEFNITALGRSGNSTSLMDTWMFNKKIKYRGCGYDCCLLYNNVSKWLLITISNKTNENTIFCGFVKNKSELKKLLKQSNTVRCFS